ncbi:MAG: ankyrin repeat domain-containing protein [Candidatus Micrarchaeia archaeon]
MALTRTKTSPNVVMLRAAAKGDWRMVYEALDSGCNVNAEHRGNSLGTIAMAQLNGHKRLEILVEDYGLDINRPIEGKYSLLSYAKNFENFNYVASKNKRVQSLLHPENAPNKYPYIYPPEGDVYNGDFLHNPIHTAIKYGFDSRAFDMLRALGFDFNLLSPYNKNTMLFPAIKYNNMAALDKLSRYINVNTPNIYSEVPIMWACQLGNAEAVSILLEHGADLSLVSDGYRNRDKYGAAIKTKKFEFKRPLLAWVKGSTKERMNIYDLLHGKADFNAATVPHGYTKYMQESFNGDLQCMKALYEKHGANPFLADRNGRTALTWSALSNSYLKFTYNLSIFMESAERDLGRLYLNELYSIKKRILSKYAAPLFEYMRIKNIEEAYGPDVFGHMEWPAYMEYYHPHYTFDTLSEAFMQDLKCIYTSVTNEIERIDSGRTDNLTNAHLYLRRR